MSRCIALTVVMLSALSSLGCFLIQDGIDPLECYERRPRVCERGQERVCALTTFYAEDVRDPVAQCAEEASTAQICVPETSSRHRVDVEDSKQTTRVVAPDGRCLSYATKATPFPDLEYTPTAEQDEACRVMWSRSDWPSCQ